MKLTESDLKRLATATKTIMQKHPELEEREARKLAIEWLFRKAEKELAAQHKANPPKSKYFKRKNKQKVGSVSPMPIQPKPFVRTLSDEEIERRAKEALKRGEVL